MITDETVDNDKGNLSSKQTDFDGNEVTEDRRGQPDNCEFSGFCDMEGMLGGFPNCFRPFDNTDWTCRRYAPHCTSDPEHCGGDDGSIQCRTCRGCVLSKVEMAYTHFHPIITFENVVTDEENQLDECMFAGSCGIELTREAFPKCYRSFADEVCKHYASCSRRESVHV